MRVLFVMATMGNALLLFAVQPMIAKMVLPLLGGTPAVWNTCMMFFQGLLLAGYWYAHLITTRLHFRGQWLVHTAFLLLALASLSVSVPWSMSPPAHGSAIGALLVTLTVSIGGPFFVLAAGAPLLQKWFHATGYEIARDPYPLYAASNLGSLLALGIYPTLVEPRLGLADQARLWAAACIAVACFVSLCGGLAARRAHQRNRGLRAGATGPSRSAPFGSQVPADRHEPAVSGSTSRSAVIRQRAMWLFMAFVPSSLLLGVTSHLTTDVAPMPLLWVVPLALYLGTFIVAFSDRWHVRAPALSALHAGLVAVTAVMLVTEMRGTVLRLGLLHLAVLVTAGLLCHGDLFRTRPPESRLTEFYLCIALGGLLGGLFNAIVAPAIFPRPLEYPAILALSCLALPTGTTEQGRAGRGLDMSIAVALLAVVAALSSLVASELLGPRIALVLLGVCAACSLAFTGRPLRFALAIAAIVLGSDIGRVVTRRSDIVFERSFFGAYRVEDHGSHQVLVHGTTVHGAQDKRPRTRLEPLTYYYKGGPVSDLFSTLPAERLHRVAVVGLGIGTLACYGQPNQRWTFFEIDPLVEKIARDARYFTYLRDCPPAKDVVIGDARLTLSSREDSTYDLIAVDAFNSDAVPVHLITLEAVSLYKRKLTPNGVILVNISNQYVDLRRVLAEISHAAGLTALVSLPEILSEPESADFKLSSRWAVLAPDSSSVEPLSRLGTWTRLTAGQPKYLWTDNYSNLLSVLRWQ